MLAEGHALPADLEVGCTCGGCPVETPAQLLTSVWAALAAPLVQAYLHPHHYNMCALSGPRSHLGTATISPWERSGHTLDCVQGPHANVLQGDAGGSRRKAQLPIKRTHSTVCPRSEVLCRHLPSASEETPRTLQQMLQVCFLVITGLQLKPALGVSSVPTLHCKTYEQIAVAPWKEQG